VPLRGQVIAVATAMQESTLRNLSYGDRDSLGLFQQRASWGPASERMDPKTAARKFYTALLQVPDLADAAADPCRPTRADQRFPDAYARWEDEAAAVVGSIAGITAPPSPTAARSHPTLAPKRSSPAR